MYIENKDISKRLSKIGYTYLGRNLKMADRLVYYTHLSGTTLHAYVKSAWRQSDAYLVSGNASHPEPEISKKNAWGATFKSNSVKSVNAIYKKNNKNWKVGFWWHEKRMKKKSTLQLFYISTIFRSFYKL